MDFNTKIIHSGSVVSKSADVSPPIHLSTIYEYLEPGVTAAGYEYGRYGNPTRAALEACLASLEAAPEDCPALCFSSGMAATDCALRLLNTSNKLVMARDVYGGTRVHVEKLLRGYGIDITYANAQIPEEFAAAICPSTTMVWIESPSNPLLSITDIRAVVEKANTVGALVVIDSTFATPYLQQPLLEGVDIVMHSTTKYLGGHSDLLGGALICKDASLRNRLYEIQKMTGGVASPFDSWLTLRGVRTLAARMRVHLENALTVAEFLTNQPQVAKVYYPGLPTHPQHELAKRQMRGFGGMVSFELEGGRPSAERFLKSPKLFRLAASLGGVESIVSYPRLMSHVGLSDLERAELGISDGLVRLSVGIEEKQDLVEDLQQALNVVI